LPKRPSMPGKVPNRRPTIASKHCPVIQPIGRIEAPGGREKKPTEFKKAPMFAKHPTANETNAENDSASRRRLPPDSNSNHCSRAAELRTARSFCSAQTFFSQLLTLVTMVSA